jgi:hypothetical protein
MPTKTTTETSEKPEKAEPKKKTRKFRLMHGKHGTATKHYVRGDVVKVEYDEPTGTEEECKAVHDAHDLSKLHQDTPDDPRFADSGPRFVEFEDDALPPLKEGPSAYANPAV